MIDIKLLRTDPDMVRELVRRRKSDVDVDRLIDVDSQLRKTTAELESLRHEQKSLKGPESREKASELKARIGALDETVKPLQTERDSLWVLLPNLLAPETPDGEDDEDNVEIARWGEAPRFDFQPKMHDEIGRDLGILDLERGATTSGAGFYYWKGDGARRMW